MGGWGRGYEEVGETASKWRRGKERREVKERRKRWVEEGVGKREGEMVVGREGENGEGG